MEGRSDFLFRGSFSDLRVSLAGVQLSAAQWGSISITPLSNTLTLSWVSDGWAGWVEQLLH